MLSNSDAVSDCLHSKKVTEVLGEVIRETSDRVKGVIAGNIIGDMLGLPFEGKSIGDCKRPILLPRAPDILLKEHLQNYKCDLYSDDTSMLLALTESLLEKGCVDKKNELIKYRQWLFEGKYTPEGRAFGYGKTTYKAVVEGVPAGTRKDNGNGALMRSSILSCFFYNRSNEFLERVSAESTSVTHGHPVSIFTNIIYNILLKDLILGKNLLDAIEDVYKRYYNLIEDINEIFFEPLFYKNTAYVVTTLQTAIWLNLESHSFMEAILKAVYLGGDADTIAAVTGAIAGAIYGFCAIPEELRVLIKPVYEKYSFLTEIC
ncbi:MAG: ADP-ribosylglycohydrolase family protein [Calditerrivibrio sp.]|nr:ADP-ribosylglycohydrolase family protein [Calditerrivibrio sp.]